MLQETTNGTLVDVNGTTTVSSGISAGSCYYETTPVFYNSWPVYITTDKTAKAIEILKLLQREKLLDLKSVPTFIKVVEQIAKAL